MWEKKQANGNFFSHSSLTEAKSGGEKVALMPATEKAFNLCVDVVKELSTEQTVWKNVKWM